MNHKDWLSDDWEQISKCWTLVSSSNCDINSNCRSNWFSDVCMKKKDRQGKHNYFDGIWLTLIKPPAQSAIQKRLDISTSESVPVAASGQYIHSCTVHSSRVRRCSHQAENPIQLSRLSTPAVPGVVTILHVNAARCHELPGNLIIYAMLYRSK